MKISVQPRILITGAQGQLGRALCKTAQDVEVIALARSELDITNRAAVQQIVARIQPHWIINAAAYTAVDQAETQPQLAHAINASAVEYLAQAAQTVQARMVQISSDYVFDGSQARPYQPEDIPHPINVYGHSKLAGEKSIHQYLKQDALIIRSAWLYDLQGQNFVHTMLRLMAERDELGVVADQIGTPTWAMNLARFIWAAITQKLSGIYHWTDAGVASWYDFAVAIQEEAVACGLLSKAIPVLPITTGQYPTPAARPVSSVLDKTKTWERYAAIQHWRVALRQAFLTRG